MTELEKLEFSQPLTDIYTDMEHDLMVEIARRLAISGEIIPSDKWRLQKLAEAGELNKEVVEIISGYTGKQSEQLTETITAAANIVLEKLEPSFRELAKEGYISGTSVPASKTEKQVVKTFRKQAETDLNLVNTVMRYKAKQAYVDLVNKSFDAVQKLPDASNRQEILNTLGKHTLSVAMGAESSQAAVRKCIQEFNRKGIPAFVDAAGRNWSPEAYVSMDIRTTVSNTAHAAVDARCDAYGIDLIAIDSHTGARPKCALDQGKVYSRSNQSGIAHDGDGNEVPFYPLSSTSYGQPDGILGINCRHHKYPFIDGVNYQRYFPIDQEENAARYKEIQEQRRLERRVREIRREIDMLTAAGDKEGAAEAKMRLTERNKEYREYCDKHKLKQQYNRTRLVKNSDTGVDKSGKNDIMKSENIRKSVSIPDSCGYLLKTDNNFSKFTDEQLSPKILETINNTIERRYTEKSDFVFDGISVGRFQRNDEKSVFITELESRGTLNKSFLYLNADYFINHTEQNINLMCQDMYDSNWWKSKTLSDLVNHEIMHAKINYHNSYEKVDRLYKTLREDERVKGFCRLVDSHPDEFMNEMYVALNNGESIPQVYIDVYNEYAKEFLGG